MIYNDTALYDFAELTEYVDPIWKVRKKTADLETIEYDPDETVYIGYRNTFLFESARMFAYEQLLTTSSYDALYEKVFDFCQQANMYQLKPMLSPRHVKATARSITRYCIKKRHAILKKMSNNPGAMNLPPIALGLEPDELVAEISRRKCLGALYTASIKHQATAARIKQAIADLIEKGERVSMGKVSKILNLSKSTISECYRYLF